MATTSTGMTCSEEETKAEIARPSNPETKAVARQHTASSRPGLPSRPGKMNLRRKRCGTAGTIAEVAAIMIQVDAAMTVTPGRTATIVPTNTARECGAGVLISAIAWKITA